MMVYDISKEKYHKFENCEDVCVLSGDKFMILENGKDTMTMVTTNLVEKTECCVCAEAITELFAIIPCGHAQTCETCLAKITKCPICKCPKTRTQQIFI